MGLAYLLTPIGTDAGVLIRAITAVRFLNALSMRPYTEQSESRTTEAIVHSRAGDEGTNVACICTVEAGIGACAGAYYML